MFWRFPRGNAEGATVLRILLREGLKMTKRANTVSAIMRAARRVIAAAALLACATSAVQAGGEPPAGRRGGPPEGRGPRGPRGPRQMVPGQQGERPASEPSQPAQPPPRPPSATTTTASAGTFPGARGAKTIGMEVYDLEIDHLLRLLSEAAGVTIIKSEQVKGPVTVIAPEPVTIEEAFRILNSVLDVRGFTMVQAAPQLYKVIPKADAMQSAVPLQFGARPEEVKPGDELITQVIPLKHLDASDLAGQIQGLLSQQASVIPTSTNSLIITDTAARIQRVLTLIADSEEQLSGGLKVFPLQYYDATEMAQLVDGLILSRGGRAVAAAARPAWEYRVRGTQPAGVRQPTPAARPAAQAAGGGGPEFCYPDARTNSLIVLATPDHLKQVEELTTWLDRPVSLRDTYFVYPVQNLVASELAQLIGPLVGAQVSAQGGGQPGRPGAGGASSGQFPGGTGGGSRFRGGPTGGIPQNPTGFMPQRSGVLRGSSTSTLEVQPLGGPGEGQAAPEVNVPVAPAGAEQVAPQPEQPPPSGPEAGIPAEVEELTGAAPQQAMITADDNANVLVISARPEQVDLIRQVLEQLDVLPPQVHIRAIIAEVALTRTTKLGIQWSKLPTLGPYGSSAVDGTFHTDFGVPTESSAGDGDTTTAVGGLFGVITGDQLEGVLHALASDGNARILSAPSIFTSNNQPARITVSESRPFPTGTISSSTSGGVISTSIQYLPVGIVLEVTPRVTQGDMVRMEVSVAANEAGESVKIAGQDYPSTKAREANAILSVKNGNTIVLGGLMRDSIERSAERVPILGDLPIIGSLFRSTSSKREKRELLVFLTLRVVRTPSEAARLTESEKSRLPEVPRSLQTPAGGPTGAEVPPAPSQ